MRIGITAGMGSAGGTGASGAAGRRRFAESTAEHVGERLSALAASGVTTLTVRPLASDHVGRVRQVERLRALADQL